MSGPWNDWYHCNGNTYGTCVQGDPRGFRERHHRRHVEGDYRNPPPAGTYDELHAQSVRSLKREPVYFDSDQRRVAMVGIVEQLQDDDIEVIAVSVDDHHFHVLARFPDRKPRHWIGRAKMHASVELGRHSLPGQAWARSSRALPIKDRSHQVNTFRYIVGHVNTGAAVWTFKDGIMRPG